MILITGCARSGTSLTAAICRALGASLGATNTLNECVAIRDGVVKPYIRALGCDPLCQHPIPTPDRARAHPLPRLREAVLAHLPGRRPCYKGAKMCHIWPLWASAFPEARWVIVRRDRDRIVDSCLRTPFMRAYDTREGWERWHDVHLARFAEMREALTVIEVWPDREMSQPEPYREMADFLGLAYRVGDVRGQIRPALWHAGG